MDFAALEAAYSAFDSDEDVDVAIGIAHRALLRAANMPAGREQRRTLGEATDRLCAALERNISEDPDFSLSRSTPRARPRNGPDTRSSSSKRARIRKVVIESDSDDEMNDADKSTSVTNEPTPARRSTRLAENVLKDAEMPSPPERVPVVEEVTETPMPDANGMDCNSSTSTVSDAEPELVLPVVRPKPQVPPLPLVSDRASQTPAITADDEDTEEEQERSRRAHAPRPRPVLEFDSVQDNLNGADSVLRAGQETVIASPFRRPDGHQATTIWPGSVQKGVIAPPCLTAQLSNGAGHPQSVPRANQRSDGISIEAEISAARASLTLAQEQQNNWIQSLNVEQERRMRAALLFSQHRHAYHRLGAKAASYRHPNTAQVTQRSGQVAPIASPSSRVMRQNNPVSQAVQNGRQHHPQVPAVTSNIPVGSNIPMNASPRPPSTMDKRFPQPLPPAQGGFNAGPSSSAFQLQIIQENLDLEKQNDKLAELYAQQQYDSKLQLQPAAGSQQAQLNEQRRQLQLREASRQQQLFTEHKRQQKLLEDQLRLERIRLMQEAHEKEKLDLQLKELENQQKQIQERKKVILQQQIELQEKHLREQQLQQQRLREQQRSRQLLPQQQAQHVLGLQRQQQIQEQRREQLLRQHQMQQQLRAQQEIAQQQFAQRQDVMRKRIEQEREQQLRAEQQLAQQRKIIQQRTQQPAVSQSHEENPMQRQHQFVGQQQGNNVQFVGHQQPRQKVQQTLKSEVVDLTAAPAARVALGHGNLSTAASRSSNQVASLSSALFSLNGTPGDGNLPRNQSIPSSAPRAPNLSSFPNTRALPAKQHQSGRGVSSAVSPSEIPALEVSSARVEGNAQTGFGTVPKNGAAGGSVPHSQRELSINNSGAVQTMYEGTAKSGKRGRGRPRGSKNRPRDVHVRSALDAEPGVPSTSSVYRDVTKLPPNETVQDETQMQNKSEVQVTSGNLIATQTMSLANNATQKPVRSGMVRGGAPTVTWLPDGTQIREIPLVRESVVDKTEIEIARPPTVRLSKRALLEWDVANLKAKQGKKELSGSKRKTM